MRPFSLQANPATDQHTLKTIEMSQLMKKIQFQCVELCSALIGWKFGHKAQLYLSITRQILKKRPDRSICFPSPRLLCFAKLYQTAVCLFANAGFHGSSFISSLSRHLQTSQHIVPCFLRWLQKSRSSWPVQAGQCVCVCGSAKGAISSHKHMARSLALASTPPLLNHELLLRSSVESIQPFCKFGAMVLLTHSIRLTMLS